MSKYKTCSGPPNHCTELQHCPHSPSPSPCCFSCPCAGPWTPSTRSALRPRGAPSASTATAALPKMCMQVLPAVTPGRLQSCARARTAAGTCQARRSLAAASPCGPTHGLHAPGAATASCKLGFSHPGWQGTADVAVFVSNGAGYAIKRLFPFQSSGSLHKVQLITLK